MRKKCVARMILDHCEFIIRAGPLVRAASTEPGVQPQVGAHVLREAALVDGALVQPKLRLDWHAKRAVDVLQPAQRVEHDAQRQRREAPSARAHREPRHPP